MAGRKAIPIEQHKLSGTFRKARHGATGGPPVIHGAPPCPEWLSASAKAAWAGIVPALAKRGVLTEADSSALQVLCTTFAEWRQLSEDLTAEGLVYECETEAGAIMRRPNPKAAMRSDAQRRLATMLAEFGLTAAARGKVPAGDVARGENPFALLDARNR